MIPRSHITGMQRAFAALLLALMTVVSAAIPVAALALAPVECGKQCCRKTKSCCCRKKPQSSTTGTVVSARTCPIGCGQPATTPILRMAWTGIVVLLLSAVPATGNAVWLPMHIAGSTLLCFALLQRPPPCKRPLQFV